MFKIELPKYKSKGYAATPLDTFNDTLSTYQTRHEQAIETNSKINEFLSAQDVHSSEQDWIAQKSNEINTAIENAATSGSFATALTTAKKVASSIVSDRGLRERVMNNAQYKAYIDKVRNDDKIDSDTKAWVLSNPESAYSKIEDVYDDNGVRIGSKGGFNGGKAYVENYDFNKLYNETVKSLKPSGSEGTNIQFIDKDGNIVEPGTLGALPGYKTKQGIEYLDANRIKTAFTSAVLNDPKARAAFLQDYQVQLWKANNSPDSSSPLKGKDGLLLSPDQYLDSMYNSRHAATAYSKVKQDISVLPGFNIHAANERAANKKTSKGTEEKLEKTAIDNTVSAGTVIIKDKKASDVSVDYKVASNELKNIYADLGISKSGDDQVDYDKAYNAIINSPLDPDTKANKLNALKASKDRFDVQSQMYNSIVTNNMTSNEKEAIDFISDIDAGYSFSNGSNKYQTKLAESVNKAFSKFDEIPTEVEIDYKKPGGLFKGVFTKEDDTADKFRAAGVDFKEKDGKLIISKDSYIKLLLKDNNVLPVSHKVVVGDKELNQTDIYNLKKDLFSTISDAKSVSKKANKKQGNEVSMTSVQAGYIPLPLSFNNLNPTDKDVKDYNDKIANGIRSLSPASITMKSRDENGVFNAVEDSKIKNELLAMINDGDAKFNTVVDPSTGEIAVIANISGHNTRKGVKEPYNYSVMLNTGNMDGIMNYTTNTPEYRAMILTHNIHNIPSFKNGYELSEDQIGSKGVKAIPNTDGSITIKTPTGRTKTLSKAQFTELITANINNSDNVHSINAMLDYNRINNIKLTESPNYLNVLAGVCKVASINSGIPVDINNLSNWAETTDSKQVATYISYLKDNYKSITGEAISDALNEELNKLIK